MKTKSIKFLTWNVRGLNCKKKRMVIKKTIREEALQILCLQETKWDTDNAQFVKQTIGGKLDSYLVINAEGTAGGVGLGFWNFH